MPKLKVLSGTDLIKIFEKFNFFIVAQKGSHIKVRRVVGGRKQVLTIPNHLEIDRGTLRAIFRQASRYMLEAELWPYFYTN